MPTSSNTRELGQTVQALTDRLDFIGRATAEPKEPMMPQHLTVLDGQDPLPPRWPRRLHPRRIGGQRHLQTGVEARRAR